MKVIVVGGVAGGASAAARARRLCEKSEIIVVERGPDVSFANCGLPYYLGGEIADRNKLLVVSPERMRLRYRLDVRVRSEVTAIDRAEKRVRIRDLAAAHEYEEHYDKLILACGAAPICPPLPGIRLPGIYTLRNLDDADRIFSALAAGRQRVVIIGAGFIGLELAENMVRRGMATTVVELQNQVLPPLDREMAAPLADEVRKHGVELLLGESATEFSAAPHGVDVKLKSGRVLPAEAVLLCVGVKPESQLATAAGLETGPRGGMRVNRHMQTSDADVYAVGDVVETNDVVTGERTQVPLAGPANRQGRIAADHIFGRAASFRGVQGTAIVRAFSLTAAMTGATEKTLVRAGLAFEKAYIHPGHHAGYYPGAQSMTLKLLFAPGDGRILGAQAVGGDGVDKRIDVLAMAIHGEMTVYDLEEVELAYAPQFGSAKDPVNMLGFVAAGVLRGDQPHVTVDRLPHARQGAAPPFEPPYEPGGAYYLDVRNPDEYARGHVPGAANIPVDELRERLGELPRDCEIITYCHGGQRGYLAARILLHAGFAVRNLSGGFKMVARAT